MVDKCSDGRRYQKQAGIEFVLESSPIALQKSPSYSVD